MVSCKCRRGDLSVARYSIPNNMRYNIDKKRRMWYIWFDLAHLSEMSNSKDAALRSAAHALDEAANQLQCGVDLAFLRLKTLVNSLELHQTSSSEEIVAAARNYNQFVWVVQHSRNAAREVFNTIDTGDVVS